MRDELTTAFIIFAMIDLTLVGTTCIAVILLVRKVMLGRVEIKIAGKKLRLDREFVTTGIKVDQTITGELSNREFVSE
jgi:hypothetical protein